VHSERGGTAATDNEDNRDVADLPLHAAKGFSFKLRIEMISAIVSEGKQMRKEMFFVQRRRESGLPGPAQWRWCMAPSFATCMVVIHTRPGVTTHEVPEAEPVLVREVPVSGSQLV